MYKVFNAVADIEEGCNGRGSVYVCRWVKAEGVCLFLDVYVCESVQRSSETPCEALLCSRSDGGV